VEKGHRRVNRAQIPCTHYVNGKMKPVETITGMGGEGDKGE
jgi:hypothetical protein